MSKHPFAEVRIPIEGDNPAIVRDESKCIKCGQCRRICEEEIAVGRLYDLTVTGDRAICIHCGQCANVCPVDSITERYEYEEVKAAIRDPEKIVVFSTSPSVRVGLGEAFGMEPGTFVEGQMVAALRALGGDYVLDTNFAADLTIMEEASELVSRIKSKDKPLPQFTSCCPAWVKFVETFYPEKRDNLSTAKSPIGMQGPTVKTYFAKANGLDPKRIVNVALTPCTAKKYEIRRDEMAAAAEFLGEPGLRDMDYVITTRELAKWMKEEGLDLGSLVPADYDRLMGEASGAGVIFGNTGGVMEAAVRTAYHFITGERPPEPLFELEPVRGMDGVRQATVEIGELTVRVAVVHGTENARQFLDAMDRGEAACDFLEVMTCRGGCIGGGGQPKTAIPMSDSVREKRIGSLYRKDRNMTLRLSHENPEIIDVYRQFYGQPLSELAEALLHTKYVDRSEDLGGPVVERPLTYEGSQSHNNETEAGDESSATAGDEGKPGAAKRKFRCAICGYEVETDGQELPEGYTCPLCGQGREVFEEG